MNVVKDGHINGTSTKLEGGGQCVQTLWQESPTFWVPETSVPVRI